MLTYLVATLSFPLGTSPPIADVKEGGGCSTLVVCTELVQCGSLRMQLNFRGQTRHRVRASSDVHQQIWLKLQVTGKTLQCDVRNVKIFFF